MGDVRTAAVTRRLRIEVAGAVQGVGFRPTVYRLAVAMGLGGWVKNTPQGLIVEVEGPGADVDRFVERMHAEAPPLAVVQSLRTAEIEPVGTEGFSIRQSDAAGEPSTIMLPDAATCPDCLADLHRPGDRRFRYPFTNCTNCGPRFTIVQALPYDRPHTTMQGFTLCPECRQEYEDPHDRRFHAQPNACPVCGPHVEYFAQTAAGWERIATNHDALLAAADAIDSGRIVAVKGLGGFHLICDAASEEAVQALRTRKSREEKPLALMAFDLGSARALIRVSDAEADLMQSAAAPIVLGERLPDAGIAPSVAPGTPTLGVMLAYTPLHHLLLEATGRPVVATSGNLRDEPICTDNDDAFDRLGAVADAFLVHDRPIARHVDDSVVRWIDGAPRFLRRSRGYAPLPVRVTEPMPPLLAVGGHLKNAIALGMGRDVFLSQHIGDLETPQAMVAFERVIADFMRVYAAEPVAVAHDLHPDYASTRWALEWAERKGLRSIAVQHHHAHLAACLADCAVSGPALGVIWDGSGYGTDGTVWGGEFLAGSVADSRRAAHLRTFGLPGGESAVREPRRCAIALLWEMGAETDDLCGFAPSEIRLLEQMAAHGVNTPRTSSAGRLFDACAALAGVRLRCSYEGQASLEFEALADPHEAGAYTMAIGGNAARALLDWEPMVRALLEDRRRGIQPGMMAARFHRGLAAGIVAVAERVGLERVVLSGGCFQNRLLSEWSAAALRRAGFEVSMHSRVPANDGGLALGQIAVAAARLHEFL